jgi:aspartate racemase
MKQKICWGVLGGMGPRASAEFLKTIYEEARVVHEQEAPWIIMDSDPSCPDRTELFLRGEEQVILDHLIGRLQMLDALGVDQIVICCLTIHSVLDRVPQKLRSRVISLVDILFRAIAQSDGEHLILCTDGSRRSGLFEAHQLWESVRVKLVYPDPVDQRKVHELIYRLKANLEYDDPHAFITSLFRKYSVRSFAACCTELHLLSRQHQWTQTAKNGISCIDPLYLAALQIVSNSHR